MKFFKKNEKKETNKLPMTGKVKKGFRFYCMTVLAMTLVLGTSVTAFAARQNASPIGRQTSLKNTLTALIDPPSAESMSQHPTAG